MMRLSFSNVAPMPQGEASVVMRIVLWLTKILASTVRASSPLPTDLRKIARTQSNSGRMRLTSIATSLPKILAFVLWFLSYAFASAVSSASAAQSGASTGLSMGTKPNAHVALPTTCLSVTNLTSGFPTMLLTSSSRDLTNSMEREILTKCRSGKATLAPHQSTRKPLATFFQDIRSPKMRNQRMKMMKRLVRASLSPRARAIGSST